MRVHELERVQIVPRERAEVFAFFADAANLERLTPPWLGFTIVTPMPITMEAGARIDYRIKLGPIPMTWRTRIERYEPEERFVDVQERGPYKLWHHTHEFRSVAGGTEIRDVIRYAIGFGPFGAVAHRLFVQRQLRAIFDHRERVMRELFA